MSMILRPEKQSLMLISPGDGKAISIPAGWYSAVVRMLDGAAPDSKETSDADKSWAKLLDEDDSREFTTWMRENPALVREAMTRSETLEPPENSYSSPLLMNLELTRRCPLRCPQCYCDMSSGRDLPLERALDVLRQAAGEGIANINLSGGETMVYPHLYRLIEECAALGLCAAVALSGYGVGGQSLRRLIDAGVGEIYISLNGSTEEISSVTRDGYPLAIRALELISEAGFERAAVNWVAHNSNTEDFPNVAALCARYGIKRLVVIAFKPDSSHMMAGAPDERQTLALASDIRRLSRETSVPSIEVENCYSPLRAYLSRRFFGNINVGISKGCGAGRDGISLDVDGNFTPCRHLDYPERFETVREYWYHSRVLGRLRAAENETRPPCDACRFGKHCLSCLAVGAKQHDRIEKANEYCFLWKKENE